MQYFSLHDLDKKIEPYVDFDNGIFFEAGANNGINCSNTAHFEFDRNWTGVLVEPIPARIDEARKNRPRSRCFHAALVPNGYPSSEVPLTYCNMMTVTRDPDRLWDGQAHVDKGRGFLERRKEEPYDFAAPARTISSILDECGISEVDLMSLDIEGFEHQAFRGLDFESLHGRYTVVEELSHHDYLLKLSE